MRPRGQQGWVEKTESGRFWRGLYYAYLRTQDGEVRRRRAVMIGSVEEYPTKRQALQRWREMLPELMKKGRGIANPTVAQMWADYVNEKGHVSASWQNQLVSLGKHVERAWKGKLAHQLTPVELEQWLVVLQEELGHSAVSKLRTHLRAAYRWAVANQRVSGKDPFELVRVRLSGQPKEQRFLEPGEYARLVMAMPTEQDQLILHVMACAGLRPQECFALRKEDIGERSLRVDEALRGAKVEEELKTRASRRMVPISESFAGRLHQFAADLALFNFLFRGDKGKPVHPNNWRNRVLKPACEQAGLVDVDLRCLRRTYSTWAGDGIATARNMGHTNLNTSRKHYLQAPDAERIAASDRVWNALMSEGGAVQ